MPALYELSLHTHAQRPPGLLGVPLHGLMFWLLEQASASVSSRIHSADVKGLRLGAWDWMQGPETDAGAEIRVLLGVLHDEPQMREVIERAFAPGVSFGDHDSSLVGRVHGLKVLRTETYSELHERHANTTGRDLQFQFLTPTTFRTTDMDMPFPVPKTLFYGLQRRWEAFSDLHLGPELGDWIGRSMRVKDFQLKSRSVYFKGVRHAALSATMGEVWYSMARPGDAQPTFVRLLADYANYAGVGYKTAYGLGHVRTAGWVHH